MAKKQEAPEQDAPLEGVIARLEEIVARLESGDVDLEASIELFAEGKKLGKTALARLEKLERRIQVVTGKAADGSLETEDFEGGER